MRDYDNMPNVKWDDPSSQYRAKAQILHQEPVVLNMPERFDYNLPNSILEQCRYDAASGIYYNCQGGSALDSLADANQQPGLHDLARACNTSHSQVDIDISGHRLIIHD